jgi:O-antigen/teichoic acid export membrane protein
MYLLIFLALINIVLNYFFIKKMGITGAAVATGLSYFLFNTGKYIFVKKSFQFSIVWADHVRIILWTLGVFVSIYALSFTWGPIVNIFVKSLLISLLLGLGVWWLNPLGEIRHMARDMFFKATKLFRHE